MKLKRIKTWLLTLTISLIVMNVWAKDVPYTLEDRDRLVRVETKIEQIDKRFEQIDKRFEQIDKRFEQIDKRFEQVDKRFDQIDRRFERLENVMIWGFGLLFTSMVGMVGFVLWDRRTAVAPVARAIKEKEAEIEELKKRERLLEEAVRDYAVGDQRLTGILKARGLL